MRLIDLIIKEYLSIVEMLEMDNHVENDRIVIDREHFKELLEKYQYVTFRQKTKVYKDLNFIIHDNNNYTMPHKDRELKKTVRKVIINYRTYQTIKHIYETTVTI